MKHRAQRGLSLVELMVGITIGLIVVAAASLLATGQLNDARRLRLEVQVDDDLRAAADLIARDLRRAGYWQHAAQQASSSGSSPNPYAEISAGTAAQPTTALAYARSEDAAGQENDAVDANERNGIKLERGTLKLLVGNAGWQSITDPDVVAVTDFRVAVETRAVPLDDRCAVPCPAAPASAVQCPPVQEVREAHIQLAGTAARDAQVKRSLQVTVRVRNDRIVGHCTA
jgi:type IV pilus assembly protein PilW